MARVISTLHFTEEFGEKFSLHFERLFNQNVRILFMNKDGKRAAVYELSEPQAKELGKFCR